MECPVARSLGQVGDAWRILILRDALLGFRRFDEFQASLGIAPNILTKRLSALVHDGLLVRRAYQHRPTRYEYAPTEKAREFSLVLAVLAEWGTRWLSPKGATMALVNRTSGEAVETALVGVESGEPCTANDLRMVAGPNAGPEILSRSTRLQQVRARSATLRTTREPTA